MAINDKVDDLLAGILKQIRIFIDAQQKKLDNDQVTNKNLKRNNSDAFINELIKKTSSGGGVHNTISFKANTLTRRLFKSAPKNKDPHTFSQTTTTATTSTKKAATSSTTSSSSSSSFSFVKFFNTLFKKKSNQSHIQSVENLFTPPVSQVKYKKLEK